MPSGERPDLVGLPPNVRVLAEKPISKNETRENEIIREQLSSVVKKSGEAVLAYRGPISDTGEHFGHELSTIDEYARSIVNKYLDELLPDIHGIRRFELRPVDIRALADHEHGDAKGNRRLVYIIDEIDGTTNTKRELANLKDGDVPKPQASTSIAVCKGKSIGSVQVGAIFTFDTGDVYSAFNTNNTYLSFKNDKLIRPSEHGSILGDSVPRVIVAGYSNTNRFEKAKWESALFDRGIRVYEGCRSSSVDIINIIRGRFDAYIDARALWGHGSGARLQAYDISASIPIALGAGFSVSDCDGNAWEKYNLNDSIPLVVSRSTSLHEKIIESVEPLLEGLRFEKGGES